MIISFLQIYMQNFLFLQFIFFNFNLQKNDRSRMFITPNKTFLEKASGQFHLLISTSLHSINDTLFGFSPDVKRTETIKAKLRHHLGNVGMIGTEIEISTRAYNPSIHLILLHPGSASSGRDRTPTVFISETIRAILYNFLNIAIVEVAKADSNHLSQDRKPLFQLSLQSECLHTHSHSRYLKYCNTLKRELFL